MEIGLRNLILEMKLHLHNFPGGALDLLTTSGATGSRSPLNKIISLKLFYQIQNHPTSSRFHFSRRNQATLHLDISDSSPGSIDDNWFPGVWGFCRIIPKEQKAVLTMIFCTYDKCLVFIKSFIFFINYFPKKRYKFKKIMNVTKKTH